MVDFLHKVVVHRRDVALFGWRSWMLEDDRVHPHRWLKPDLVALAPFLCCDPGLTIDGPLCRASLDISPAVGLSSFGDHVRVLYDVVVDFLHRVVVFRRDVAVRSWRSWMLEDDKVHPYRWLRPDLVAPAPLLCCDPCLTVDGSGFFLILIALMSSFVKLGSLSFVGLVVMPLILLLLIGRLAAGFLTWERLIFLLFWGPICIMLFSISRLRIVVWTVGGWRDLKAFPESWFDWLAVVLSGVELDGIWPEGLLDAHITMIPKADGDATPLGQRPAFCLSHFGVCQVAAFGRLASVLALVCTVRVCVLQVCMGVYETEGVLSRGRVFTGDRTPLEMQH